jgi:diguanylate cyclase (GGDEF)-like protein/PAS domain S-box-containing protein
MPSKSLQARPLSPLQQAGQADALRPTQQRFSWIGQLPLAVFLVGLVITGGVAEQTRRFGVQEHERIERNLLNGVSDAINAKIQVDIALLSSVVGLFRASEAVNREEFAQFYAAMAAGSPNFQGIQGVGFSRFLKAEQLPQFVAQMRAQGFKDFRIIPAGNRPNYSVIDYIEPFDWRNRRAFGFDMYSEPARHAAMERAARTGLASLTARLTLIQETESAVQPGVLMYVPVYRGNLADLDPQERMQQLVGWAYSPLRTGDLIDAALSDVGNRDLSGSRVVVFDGPTAQPQALLFDNLDHLHGVYTPVEHASFNRLAVGGRTWSVGVQLAPHLVGPKGISSQFWVVIALGLGVASLLAIGTRMLVDSHLATSVALATSEKAIEERALASTVFEASSLAIVVTNPDGYFLTANNAFTQLSGYRVSEIVGQRTNLLKSGRHDQGFYKTMWDTLLSKGFWEGDLWNKIRNGELRRHHLAISTVRDDQLRSRYFVGMLQDITDRHAAEEAVRYQALHDNLTGLANRSLLMEQLEREVALGRRHGQPLGVLYLDLDGFKPVNDQLGHAAGDLLLQQVAERLRDCTRESDVICRQGGDEFVVLVPQAGELPELEALATKLVTKLNEPFSLDLPAAEHSRPCSVRISVSIGIARFPNHADNADGLLLAADNAMYRAKAAGGGSQRLAVA